jgi:hypothetical protein
VSDRERGYRLFVSLIDAGVPCSLHANKDADGAFNYVVRVVQQGLDMEDVMSHAEAHGTVRTVIGGYGVEHHIIPEDTLG